MKNLPIVLILALFVVSCASYEQMLANQEKLIGYVKDDVFPVKQNKVLKEGDILFKYDIYRNGYLYKSENGENKIAFEDIKKNAAHINIFSESEKKYFRRKIISRQEGVSETCIHEVLKVHPDAIEVGVRCNGSPYNGFPHIKPHPHPPSYKSRISGNGYMYWGEKYYLSFEDYEEQLIPGHIEIWEGFHEFIFKEKNEDKISFEIKLGNYVNPNENLVLLSDSVEFKQMKAQNTVDRTLIYTNQQAPLRQKVESRNYLAALVKRCIGFGFTEATMPTCIQQETFNDKKLAAISQQQSVVPYSIAQKPNGFETFISGLGNIDWGAQIRLNKQQQQINSLKNQRPRVINQQPFIQYK